MKSFIKSNFPNIFRIAKQAQKRINYKKSKPVTLLFENRNNGKWALLSYITEGLLLPPDSEAFKFHSNVWENREIAQILLDLGFNVDAINWNDDQFRPKKKYDIVIDICYNLARLNPYLDNKTLKLLHCTGSDPFYQNNAELNRVEQFNKEYKSNYIAKRLLQDPDLSEKSIIEADFISLLGNRHTLSTYPQATHEKISLIPVTSSQTNQIIKGPGQYLPNQREFLWFFGAGAVHKGLDIVLSVFKRHPEYTLNVVGGWLEHEPDFIEIFSTELFETKNIHYFGTLKPSSNEFLDIINRSFCFIAPSCSEGTSPAVVTCIQIGLFPIISMDTGVDLPTGCGSILTELSPLAVEQSICQLTQMLDADIENQISRCQAYALEYFSRENFHASMKTYIMHCLVSRDKKITKFNKQAKLCKNSKPH